mgnify:CR=1 FL=1
MVADWAQDTFFLGGLQNAVVFIITADWFEIRKPAFADLSLGFFNQKDPRLSGLFGVKTKGVQAGDLFFYYLTRFMVAGPVPYTTLTLPRMKRF